jgi:hypothetical protein
MGASFLLLVEARVRARWRGWFRGWMRRVALPPGAVDHQAGGEAEAVAAGSGGEFGGVALAVGGRWRALRHAPESRLNDRWIEA